MFDWQQFDWVGCINTRSRLKGHKALTRITLVAKVSRTQHVYSLGNSKGIL